MDETSDSLKRIWTKEIYKEKPSEYEVDNPDKHGKYISYYSPVSVGRDTVIAIKTSLSAPSSFVLINLPKKTEKRIHTPGQVYPYFVSYAKRKLVWVETESDHRWANREYSVIKLMDLKSRRVIKLTRKSRYLAASISPDGSRIAAVENSVRNVNNLVLLNVSTGEKIRSFQVPENVYLQHPQWSEDGRKITFIFLSGAGEGVMSFDPESQKWETLVGAGRDDLQSSFLKNDSLFYISSSSGTDNIYLLTSDKKTTEITNSRFGTIDVSPGANNLLFSDYTSLGNNICSTKIPVTPGTSRSNISSSSFLIDRFDIKPPPVTADTSMTFTPVPYRKWEHLFRFHSWMPFYANISSLKIDPASLSPGVTLLTQNTLSTLISTFRL